jgi:23S rRNA (guanosine2251-2'-O)-methyltransferase
LREFLFRRNAVLEALRGSRRTLHVLHLQRDLPAKYAQPLASAATARAVPVEYDDKARLSKLAGDSSHQGAVLEAGSYPYAELREMFALARNRAELPLLLLLDLLHGPQNIGMLLRTAEACGVHGVIMQERRAPDITPHVVSYSAGATEHLLIGQVANLVETMRRLKAQDVWIAGLDIAPDARQPGDIDLDRPLALVVGHEGEGLRRLVRDSCDFLLQLPMRGRVESLNAAVAASLALYLAWQARGFVGAQVG